MLRQTRTLSYAARGAAYEDMVAGVLGAFGIVLDRVGGANDRGIDLRGFWASGSPSAGSDPGSGKKLARTAVSVQCKHYNTRPVTPRDVREFEGAVAQDRAHAAAGCLGILASATGFSAQAKRCAVRGARAWDAGLTLPRAVHLHGRGGPWCWRTWMAEPFGRRRQMPRPTRCCRG